MEHNSESSMGTLNLGNVHGPFAPCAQRRLVEHAGSLAQDFSQGNLQGLDGNMNRNILYWVTCYTRLCFLPCVGADTQTE